MYSENSDYRMREALNVRIATVVISLLVAAVLGWAIYGLWDSSRDGRVKTQEARLACIAEGGTWLDSTNLEMCLLPGQAVPQ